MRAFWEYTVAILGIFAKKLGFGLVFLLGFMAFVKEGSLGILGWILVFLFFIFIFCPM